MSLENWLAVDGNHLSNEHAECAGGHHIGSFHARGGVQVTRDVALGLKTELANNASADNTFDPTPA